MLCRLYAIVINVLHFCFELCALKMTSKMKHMKALFFSLLSYRIRFVIMLRLYRLSAQICYVYIVLFWALKALYIEVGNLLNHHQCAASTWMMRRQPYCARTPTTHHSHTIIPLLPFPFPLLLPQTNQLNTKQLCKHQTKLNQNHNKVQSKEYPKYQPK